MTSRPGGIQFPRQRSAGSAALEIVVDARESAGFEFAERQAIVLRADLRAGQYGVRGSGGQLAAVCRMSLDDLLAAVRDGLLLEQLPALASVPHAALVVEDRYGSVFKQRRVRPGLVAETLAECQVRWPQVPIVFADSRRLAQEWVFRFLAAVQAEAEEFGDGSLGEASGVGAEPAKTQPFDFLGQSFDHPPVVPHQLAPHLEPTIQPAATASEPVTDEPVDSEPVDSEPVDTAPARPMAAQPSGATNAEIREWALANGWKVAPKGPVRRQVRLAFEQAQRDRLEGDSSEA